MGPSLQASSAIAALKEPLFRRSTVVCLRCLFLEEGSFGEVLYVDKHPCCVKVVFAVKSFVWIHASQQLL